MVQRQDFVLPRPYSFFVVAQLYGVRGQDVAQCALLLLHHHLALLQHLRQRGGGAGDLMLLVDQLALELVCLTLGKEKNPTNEDTVILG